MYPLDHHWVRLKLRHNYITMVNLSKIKELEVVSNSEICLHNVFLRCLKNTEARRRVASSTATVIKFSWRSVGNSCSWISLLDPKGRIILFWGTKTAQLPGRPFFYIIWCIIVWGTFLTLLLFYSIGRTPLTFLVFLV